MKQIPFNNGELKVSETVINFKKPDAPHIPVYTFPITPRENVVATYSKTPVWCMYGTETFAFSPKIIPDNVARGFLVEAVPVSKEQYGGKDMFGVVWEFVPQVGGSMVRPGNPMMTDANDWKERIRFPSHEEIDAWAWEQSAEENKVFLNNGRVNFFWMQNGCWFERLISFMEVQNACIALIDEEQQAAVKEIFEATTDLYCYIVDKVCDTYGDNITGFTVHDDWGTQRAPFFSYNTGKEMIVPYMKKLTDHIHSRGKLAELHSCGKNETQIQNFIDAGWDFWCPMYMNDTSKLYDEYGDKIIISVCDEPMASDATEEAQYERGVQFAKRYCKIGKPAVVNGVYNPGLLTPKFCEGLYITSRKIYAGEI